MVRALEEPTYLNCRSGIPSLVPTDRGVLTSDRMMPRALPVLALAAFAATSCGSGFSGDCSGGRFDDGRCVNTRPAVHWTAARAAVAADRFTYAPMVRGELSNARCRIVDRRPAFEATADCKATFTAPGRAPRRLRVVFDLSGIGAVNPACDRPQANDPFCRWERAHP